MSPHLALANERQRLLRVGGLEFPSEAVAIENGVECVAGRVTVADAVDRPDFVRLPLGLPPLELGV